MKPFPYPFDVTPGDINTSFCQDNGSMTVTLTDEGGGHFLIIKTEEQGVRLEPGELAAIAQWAADACAEMDEVSK
jgi:hypothetical protein